VGWLGGVRMGKQDRQRNNRSDDDDDHAERHAPKEHADDAVGPGAERSKDVLGCGYQFLQCGARIPCRRVSSG
jgi:hypothetical protein